MKILFLDIDGVLNNTSSTLTKVGAFLKSSQQEHAIRTLHSLFGDEDKNIPYGIQYTIDSIDPVSVGLVNRLLDKDDDLRIVLSSTHRKFFCGSRYLMNGVNLQFGSAGHLNALRVYMHALGLRGDRLHDITDNLHIPRGREVRLYLEIQEEGEVTHHCAVDDGADFEPDDCNFVQTDAVLGLQSDQFFRISRHLAIVESPILY